MPSCIAIALLIVVELESKVFHNLFYFIFPSFLFVFEIDFNYLTRNEKSNF